MARDCSPPPSPCVSARRVSRGRRCRRTSRCPSIRRSAPPSTTAWRQDGPVIDPGRGRQWRPGAGVQQRRSRSGARFSQDRQRPGVAAALAAAGRDGRSPPDRLGPALRLATGRQAGLPQSARVWAPPGRYTVVLTAGGKTLRQPLVIVPDPRVTASPASYQAEFDLARRIEADRGRVAAALKANAVRRRAEGLGRAPGQAAGWPPTAPTAVPAPTPSPATRWRRRR